MPDIPITDMERQIARRLQTRRKLLEISVERIAFAIDHSTEEYTRYETSETRIMPTLLHELANLLDVPMEYFFVPHGG